GGLKNHRDQTAAAGRSSERNSPGFRRQPSGHVVRRSDPRRTHNPSHVKQFHRNYRPQQKGRSVGVIDFLQSAFHAMGHAPPSALNTLVTPESTGTLSPCPLW